MAKTEKAVYREDDVVDIKFHVDVYLEKDDKGIYVKHNIESSPLAAESIVRGAFLNNPHVGMEFRSANKISAGSVVKMYKKEADYYLNGVIQQRGFKSDKFTTDPNDPRLYESFPVAEIAA